jgi:hypothetical protein
MNTIQLLRETQADNRYRFAEKQRSSIQASESNLSGRVLGKNAETGQFMVQLDRGGVIPATGITNGNLDGKSAIVSMNGPIAFVDGMPG